jgi:monoamine oxidase
MDAYDDRDDKPSWSEIDKLKDRSKHASQEKREVKKKETVREDWAKKQYMKEIEKLFSGEKEETEEQKKARKALVQRYGSSKFNSAVDQYVKKFGMPQDWSTLMLMLDHRNVAIVTKALEVLRQKIQEGSETEQEGFKSKVKIIAMTAENDDLQALAEEIVDDL